MKQCFDEGSYATQIVNIEEFNSKGTGYGDDHANAMSLFFADSMEATENVQTFTQLSINFGLEINKAKNGVMIFNFKEQPEHIENVEMPNNYKRLQ